jgi:hypothetical protein
MPPMVPDTAAKFCKRHAPVDTAVGAFCVSPLIGGAAMDRSCERFRKKGCFSVAARYPLGEKQPFSRNLEQHLFQQG